MADTRTYIRVHDGMPDHPKVDGLSDKAFRLLVESWCWCSRHLTDGRIPAATWKKRGTAAARKQLLAAGLVEELPGGDVQMHDYLEHQRSAEKVAEVRAAKAQGGSFGNHVRWHVDKGVVKDWCEHCPRPPDEDDPEDVAYRSDERSHMRSGKGSRNGNSEPNDGASIHQETDVIKSGDDAVDNPTTSGNAQNSVANGSHMRSHPDRKSSPVSVSENIGGPSVPNDGSPSPHLSLGDARARENDDEDQPLDTMNGRIEGRIIELIALHAGRTVDRAWASKVRSEILDERDVRDPLAYVSAAIRGEPLKYVPLSGASWDQPPPELGPANPDGYQRGGQLARELLAAKRRSDQDEQGEPEPDGDPE